MKVTITRNVAKQIGYNNGMQCIVEDYDATNGGVRFFQGSHKLGGLLTHVETMGAARRSGDNNMLSRGQRVNLAVTVLLLSQGRPQVGSSLTCIVWASFLGGPG